MKFTTIEDPDFQRVLKLIEPEKFLDYMVSKNMLNEKTGNYGSDVHDLCNNACAWAVGQIQDTGYIIDFEVIHGTFRGLDHQWMKISSFYIDLTLAQFVDDCPKLAIVEKKEAEGYCEHSIRSAFTFIEELKQLA